MYKLDDQATRKLAEWIQNRTETREADIDCLHRHLETSNKPSARVMMMIGKLKSTDIMAPLPEPDKRIAPGSYLDLIAKDKERKKDRSKSRDRRRHPSRDRDRR